MTQKKKAELQRKLGMFPVPKPPDDLLDRIKGDIPSNLMSTERDRDRLSRAVSLSMRVAASILLLVTSAFLAMQIFQSEKGTPWREVTSVPDSKPQAASAKSLDAVAPAPAEAAPKQAMAQTEARGYDEEPAAKRERDDGATPRADAPARQAEQKTALFIDDAIQEANGSKKDDGDRKEKVSVTAAAPATVGGVAENQVARAAEPPPPPPAAPSVTIVDFGAITGGTASTRAAAAPSAADANAVETTGLRRQNAPVSQSAAVSKMAANRPAPARTVFGISLDNQEFARLKSLIDSGEKPPAAGVNIGALVNHFAGSSDDAPRDVQLQVEASRAPLTGESDIAILRYTIDTSAKTQVETPAATNARLSIELNENVIDDYRLVANGSALRMNEPILAKNISATGLVELHLKPAAAAKANVATIRLIYRSARTGQEMKLEQSVKVRDLRRSWLEASTRHRLATLGAVWGESLKGAPASDELAKTAEELAKREPDDARAKDLAAAATASSRLQSSGPTGSER